MNRFLYALLFVLEIGFASAQPGAMDPDFVPNLNTPGEDAEYKVSNFSVLQPDGKVLLVSHTFYKSEIKRMDTQGKKDPAFHPVLFEGGINKILLQPDGKFLVVYQAGCLRYHSNGIPDPTFVQRIDSASVVFAAETDANGRILLAGKIHRFHHPDTVAVVRLFSDGELDTLFSSPFTGSKWGRALCMAPNGKVLVGIAGENRVYRLFANGSIDTGFSGTVVSGIRSLVLCPDQTILAGGSGSNVIRLLPNGGVDSAFQAVSYSTPRNWGSIIATPFFVDAAGRLLCFSPAVDNSTRWKNTLDRYTTNGTLDPTFSIETDWSANLSTVHALPNGSLLVTGYFYTLNRKARAGMAVVSENGTLLPGYYTPAKNAGTPYAIAVQPDGKIVVAGDFTEWSGKERFRLARLEPNGELDSTFVPVYAPNLGDAERILVQPDGKILVIQNTYWNTDSEILIQRFQLSRYLAGGAPDASFSSLVPDCDTLGIQDMALQPDGKIIVCGTFTKFAGQPRSGLARLLPDGTLDPTFLPSHPVFHGSASKLTLQPDGKILMSSSASGMDFRIGRLLRFLSDGTLDPSFLHQSGLSSPHVSNQYLMADGRILVLGWFNNYAGKACNGMVFLDHNGVPDSTRFATETSNVYNNSHRVIPLSDGRFYLFRNGNQNEILLFNGDGTVDSAGTVSIPVAGYRDQIFGMALQPTQNRLLVFERLKSLLPGGITRLAGFILPQNAPAATTHLSGSVFSNQNSDCNQQAGEWPMPQRFVKAEPGPLYGSTNGQGTFRIAADTGSYTVSQLISANPVAGQVVSQICPANNGNYTATLHQAGDSASGLNFANHAIHCPDLHLSVGMSRLRRCAANLASVTLSNWGTVNSDTATTVFLRLPKHVLLKSASHPFTYHPEDSTSRFRMGTIPALESRQLQLIDSVACVENITGTLRCLDSWFSPANSCTPVSPLWDGADLVVNGRCQYGQPVFAVRNLGNPMAQPSPYRLFADSILAYTGNLQLASGDSLVLTPSLSGNFRLRLEVSQPAYHPTSSFAFAETSCSVLPALKSWFSPAAETSPVQTTCLTVRDSYDPNDKQVSPQGVGREGYVEPGRPMEYTIRFQNTGNDTAYTVVVKDYLDSDFDLSSFQPGAASHPYTVSLSGVGKPELEFRFQHIGLVDSATNPLKSQGFVQYRIWPKADAVAGMRLYNVADIYFDQNIPIRTNHTLNTLYRPELVTGMVDSVSARPTPGNLRVLLYPNPSDGECTLQLNKAARLTLFNLLGQRLDEQPLPGGKNMLSFDRLQKGMYFVLVTSESEKVVQRLVIK